MKIVCVIPAYNEAKYISRTLNSILNQEYMPDQVVVVDDNSSDETHLVVQEFVDKHTFIKLITNISENKHLPGSKVIGAFYKGYDNITSDFDIIVKLDADLILPENYFKEIVAVFQKNSRVGLVGGFAYIKKNEQWVLEDLTDKDHIRGAFKAYRKSCFNEIGGLKLAMGWDTVDELLCRYFNWRIITLAHLKVKHLKPTGAVYNKSARYKQGKAFYALGYGFCITFIASLKLAFKKNKPLLFIDYIIGFFKAKQNRTELLVTRQQAKFIRKYRWKKMKEKLGF